MRVLSRFLLSLQSPRRTLRRYASLSLWAVCVVLAGPAVGEPGRDPVRDPLERPSKPSARAASVLLTSVERTGDRLVAVGERGTVLTCDDGKQWIQRPTPVSVLLTNVRFGKDGKGWAVGHGGVVLRTVDGGLNWTRQLEGVQLAQVVLKAAEARAASAPAGTPAAEAAQLAVQAAKLLVEDGPDKPLFDVLIDDDAVLVVGAYGLALLTRDDGATWQDWQDRIPNPAGSHLYAARRIGAALYLAGEQGSVFRSTDKGQRFMPLAVPYKGSFFGLAEVGEGGVMVFGLRGHAFVSIDEGAQWRLLPLPTTATVTGGHKLKDGSTALVTQAGQVLITPDRAESFKALKVVAPVPFVGLGQAADGSLVMAGVRGITVIPLNSSSSKTP
jgi:photosystem II stability/assembly factor-like uncharacterized protein